MNLFADEKFKKAHRMVAERASGYCVDQSKASATFVWEMWLVGKTFVLVTARHNKALRETHVEVWAPITDSNAWEDTELALEIIKAKA